MDEYCDTHSLLVQLSEDFDECLYFGPAEMVRQFGAAEGIRISNLEELIRRSESWIAESEAGLLLISFLPPLLLQCVRAAVLASCP